VINCTYCGTREATLQVDLILTGRKACRLLCGWCARDMLRMLGRDKSQPSYFEAMHFLEDEQVVT